MDTEMTNRTESEPTTEAPAIRIDDVLSVLFPTPAGGLVTLVADVPGEPADAYFRRLPEGWVEQRSERVVPGFARFLDTHHGADVFVSFVQRAAPAPTSPILPVSALWATRRLTRTATTWQHTLPPVDARDAQAVRVRLLGAAVPPTVLICGGITLSAVWALTAPLHVARATHLLHRLAVTLDADRGDAADPVHALLALPGSRCTRTVPATTVRVELFEPSRRYPLAAIERWLDTGGA